MSDAPAGPVDPLLRAIAEFRNELNRLLEEPARPGVRAVEFLPSLAAASVPEAADEGKGRASDPRPRLDALAKHLDLRRRLGNGPAPVDRADHPNEPAAIPTGGPRC